MGSLGNDEEIYYRIWEYFEEFNDDGDPTIFPLNTDWDLEQMGTIHFNDLGDRAVITWNEIGTYKEGEHLATFQVQLLKDGTIIFGYNGILDGEGEDLLNSLSEGILVGISESDGTDEGSSDLSSGRFIFRANTVYELWCYDEADSCDGDRPGPVNTAFDLDQMNVIFTPRFNGGFIVSNTLDSLLLQIVPVIISSQQRLRKESDENSE